MSQQTTGILHEAQQAVQELLDSRKMTASEFARRIGVSAGMISSIKKGTYPESDGLKRVIKEANKILGKTRGGWALAPTHSFNTMQGLMAICQADGVSAGIAAAPGSGKTASCMDYYRKNDSVIYLQCADYFTRSSFMRKLMQAMGLTPEGLRMDERVEAVIEHIKGMDAPLLILDEADKLRDNVLPLYRVLYNELDGECGFLLVGTHYLKKKLERGVKYDKLSYRETFSAIGGKLNALEDPSKEDVELVCRANGIEEHEHIQYAYNNSKGDMRRVKRLCEKWRNASSS